MSINWNIAIVYAKLVAIAESLAPGAPYAQQQYDAIVAVGYNFLQPIYGDDIVTEQNPTLGRTVSFGFLAISPSRKEIVAAIRGTEGIWEWIDDARFLMIRCPIANSKGLTEDGFSSVYQSLRSGSDASAISVKDAIKNYLDQGMASSVTVCGHSLGGALATLLTLDVALNTSCTAPQSYTYASPKTGNHAFANAYDESVPGTYRIANRKDLVPKLPLPFPLLPYEHVNTIEELNPAQGAINPTIVCLHSLATYLWLMGQQLVGPNPCKLDNGCLPSR